MLNLKNIIIFSMILLSIVFISPLIGEEARNSGKGTSGNPYKVNAIDIPMKIDGNLNESSWEKATLISLDYEVSPGENAKPPVRT